MSYAAVIGMEGVCCMLLHLLHSFSLLYGYFDGAYVALIPVVTSDVVGSSYLTSALGVVYLIGGTWVTFSSSLPVTHSQEHLLNQNSTASLLLLTSCPCVGRLVGGHHRKLRGDLLPQRGVLHDQRGSDHGDVNPPPAHWLLRRRRRAELWFHRRSRRRRRRRRRRSRVPIQTLLGVRVRPAGSTSRYSGARRRLIAAEDMQVKTIGRELRRIGDDFNRILLLRGGAGGRLVLHHHNIHLEPGVLLCVGLLLLLIGRMTFSF
ncbi:uncharacterized protein AB9W97_019445 isoform 2-T2 [Spinachia spinachia]